MASIESRKRCRDEDEASEHRKSKATKLQPGPVTKTRTAVRFTIRRPRGDVYVPSPVKADQSTVSMVQFKVQQNERKKRAKEKRKRLFAGWKGHARREPTKRSRASCSIRQTNADDKAHVLFSKDWDRKYKVPALSYTEADIVGALQKFDTQDYSFYHQNVKNPFLGKKNLNFMPSADPYGERKEHFFWVTNGLHNTSEYMKGLLHASGKIFRNFGKDSSYHPVHLFFDRLKKQPAGTFPVAFTCPLTLLDDDSEKVGRGLVFSAYENFQVPIGNGLTEALGKNRVILFIVKFDGNRATIVRRADRVHSLVTIESLGTNLELQEVPVVWDRSRMKICPQSGWPAPEDSKLSLDEYLLRRAWPKSFSTSDF